MKVLLVNPPPYRIQEAYYDTPPYPRTGLAYLAGHLRANGVDVRVLDCKFDRLTHSEAIEGILAAKPDVVGFTAFTNEIMQAAALARDVKAARRTITTIIGGVHATILPERTLRDSADLDYAVIGEGERTLVELVRALSANGDKPAIPGVGFLDEENRYRFGGEREKVADLDSLALPAWDLFRPAREYILHTQRGCPYHCPFCVNPNGRKIRAESVERVLDDVSRLQEQGCGSILFGDEVFTLNRARVVALCNGFIERGLHKRIRWRCVTHINSIDYDLARLLRRAGCYLVGLGLESGDPERLKAINKGTNVEKIRTVVKDLKRAALPFEGYFILGQPNETVESAKAAIDFAIQVNPNYPVFGIMVPYPGTEIGRMAEAGEGGYRLIAKDWNDYNKQIGDAVTFTGVDRCLLEKMQFMGYIRVFLKNWRLLDFVKFSWQYRSNGLAVLKRLLPRRLPTFGRVLP
jgi:anaerobic magnesium-protoporphyrin IX monomethyl ester cyclase